MQRVLPLQDLLHEVRDNVAHSELDVAAPHVVIAKRAPLADAHAVERPDDREWQGVLLMSPAREEFVGELLKAVCRAGRRAGELGSFGRREDRRALEHHAARNHGDLLQPPAAKRADGGVEGRGGDPLVFRQQVVCEFVEVGDSPDHRRPRDHLGAVRGKLGEERRILGVALDQSVARVVVERPPDRTVLTEVVDSDDLVPRVQELGDEISANESRRAGDENLHAICPGVALPGRLTRVVTPPPGIEPDTLRRILPYAKGRAAPRSGAMRWNIAFPLIT